MIGTHVCVHRCHITWAYRVRPRLSGQLGPFNMCSDCEVYGLKNGRLRSDLIGENAVIEKAVGPIGEKYGRHDRGLNMRIRNISYRS